MVPPRPGLAGGTRVAPGRAVRRDQHLGVGRFSQGPDGSH